jgi:phosphohistidine phosphatase
MLSMKRLILLRHAKSAWTDPDLDDHDRPLNQRGRLSAPLMGAWLAERGFVPDAVLSSSSARTVETWARARTALPDAPDATVDAGLYHADPARMLVAIHAAPPEAGTLLLIGHQPGIGALTRRLSSPDAPATCTRAYQKFPTAACAVIDFDTDRWSDIAWGTGRFHSFAVPREQV